MGSFTTSNGTATNLEQKFDESTPPQTTPSNGHPPANHKHPPLSYVQHMRPMQHHSQQNLSQSSQQQQKNHLPARPLSGDISSFMTRSASSDFRPSNDFIPTDPNVRTSSFCSFFFLSFISSDFI